jgi:putative membrane protein
MRTLTLIAVLLIAPPTLANRTHDNPPSQRQPAKAAKLTAKELQVAAHYHELDQTEVALGQAALRISRNLGVRTYAEMLIIDHSDSDKRLVALVAARGQTIPVERPTTAAARTERIEGKARVAKLKAMKGAEFDSAFIQAMIDGHEKELSMVDAFAEKVTDAELGEAVRVKKSTLQHHADEARALRGTDAVATR